MPELQYVLRFERTAADGPTTATGQVVTTKIDAGGAVCTTRQQIGGSASYVSTFELDPDDPNRFTEWGTVTIDGAGTLSFSSVGCGFLQPPADPATKMTPGVVMWGIDGGTGAFAGARGTITSNFRVDLATEALCDDQVATILLPAS